MSISERQALIDIARQAVAAHVCGFEWTMDEPAGELTRLASNAEEREAIGQRAREAVVRTRDWERIAERYFDIYGRLIERGRAAA